MSTREIMIHVQLTEKYKFQRCNNAIHKIYPCSCKFHWARSGHDFLAGRRVRSQNGPVDNSAAISNVVVYYNLIRCSSTTKLCGRCTSCCFHCWVSVR